MPKKCFQSELQKNVRAVQSSCYSSCPWLMQQRTKNTVAENSEKVVGKRERVLLKYKLFSPTF
jgi:hypothetical protein